MISGDRQGVPKATALTGDYPCSRASWWPGPDPPASPPLQGRSKPGRGGARPQGRARSGCFRSRWEGALACFGFAKPVWGREGTVSVEGAGGRPVSVRESNLAPWPGGPFVFNFVGQVVSNPTPQFSTVLALSRRLQSALGPRSYFRSKGPGNGDCLMLNQGENSVGKRDQPQVTLHVPGRVLCGSSSYLVAFLTK